MLHIIGVGFLIFSMAEELEVLCQWLNLSDREKQHTRLQRDLVSKSFLEAKHSLLFKLLTTRQFNGMAFMNSIQSLWGSTTGLTIREIDDNLFLAVFQAEADLDHICVQSPWTFDKKLIQFVQFDGDIQPTEVKF